MKWACTGVHGLARPLNGPGPAYASVGHPSSWERRQDDCRWLQQRQPSVVFDQQGDDGDDDEPIDAMMREQLEKTRKARREHEATQAKTQFEAVRARRKAATRAAHGRQPKAAEAATTGSMPARQGDRTLAAGRLKDSHAAAFTSQAKLAAAASEATAASAASSSERLHAVMDGGQLDGRRQVRSTKYAVYSRKYCIVRGTQYTV